MSKNNHLYVTQKINSVFLHHKIFIFSFYIAHWQHVDLLLSGPRNKETFKPSFTSLLDIQKQEIIAKCLLCIKKCRWTLQQFPSFPCETDKIQGNDHLETSKLASWHGHWNRNQNLNVIIVFYTIKIAFKVNT